MKNTAQSIKRIALFLFGVVLIVSGYETNSPNNETVVYDEKDKTSLESEQHFNQTI